jgi:hypothetical protein
MTVDFCAIAVQVSKYAQQVLPISHLLRRAGYFATDGQIPATAPFIFFTNEVDH